MAEILKASGSSYDRAISLLKARDPVALPTETVYGLAALATDDDAVASIYKIKSRPRLKPFSIVVGSVESAQKIAKLSPMAKKMAEAFWPGPLTLILPLQNFANISPFALGNDDTIGIRCPDIPWIAHFNAAGFKDPLILPSANTSGTPAPTSAQEVDQDIGEKIPLIVDAGNCKTGIESTIIKIENETGTVLRFGALAPEDLAPYRLDWSAV